MPLNVAQKLITAHLVDGSLRAGTPITLKIDQTLTQDATGTLVMLTLEALRLDRVRTEVSVQYVDHNLLQIDNLNADDHLFLESACRRFGVWYSRPGNGISHVVHMQRFGIPGKSLFGLGQSHARRRGARHVGDRRGWFGRALRDVRGDRSRPRCRPSSECV